MGRINSFLFKKLSGIYLNTIKDRLYCGKPDDYASILQVLQAQLYIVSKILWPVVPFIVEECWSYHTKGERPFYEVTTKTPPAEWKNSEFDDCIHIAKRIRTSLEDSVNTKDKIFWRSNVIIEANDKQIDELEVCSKPHRQQQQQNLPEKITFFPFLEIAPKQWPTA